MSRLFGTSFLARTTGMLCLAAGMGIWVAPVSDARAQVERNGGMTQEESQQYRDCIKLAQLKPEDGFESAIAWRDLGGGEPAAIVLPSP